MSDRHLHIISFDVPYPPDYGGVIDVYNRIVALSGKGIKIHLHCYDYGRGQQKCLEELCVEVKYYKRKAHLPSLLSRRPYIVQSRVSEDLAKDLLCDNYPILCEGMHTAFIVEDKRFAKRNVYVRMHNVEHDYYRMLAKSETRLWKHLFYGLEWRKLRDYERILPKIKNIIAISQADCDYFSRFVPNVILVPGFNSYGQVMSKEGRGGYVLYHGNLSVNENAKAAEWLVANVFPELDMACVVAGRDPLVKLTKMVQSLPNVSLVANPSDDKMRGLLADAQINVLVTDQPTGMKLKLLNALYVGRHCVVNSNMLHGTGLDALCHIADTSQTMVETLNKYRDKPFTSDDISNRASVLDKTFSNDVGADKIISFIDWQ